MNSSSQPTYGSLESNITHIVITHPSPSCHIEYVQNLTPSQNAPKAFTGLVDYSDQENSENSKNLVVDDLKIHWEENMKKEKEDDYE